MLATGKATYGRVANAVTAFNNAPIFPDTFTCLKGYLVNLVAAAMTECTMPMRVINNYATFTTNVKFLTASIASLTAAYAIFAAGKQAPCTSPNTAAKSNKQSYLATNGYCWMHGY